MSALRVVRRGVPARRDISVRGVRGWLDERESGIHVVFGVFLESDERIYRDILFI